MAELIVKIVTTHEIKFCTLSLWPLTSVRVTHLNNSKWLGCPNKTKMLYEHIAINIFFCNFSLWKYYLWHKLFLMWNVFFHNICHVVICKLITRMSADFLIILQITCFVILRGLLLFFFVQRNTCKTLLCSDNSHLSTLNFLQEYNRIKTSSGFIVFN